MISLFLTLSLNVICKIQFKSFSGVSIQIMVVEARQLKSTLLEAVPVSSRNQHSAIWFYYMEYVL